MLSAGGGQPIEKIAVIGGGRWARVITEVLGSITGAEIALSIHSVRNCEGLRYWIREKGLSNRITGSASLPDSDVPTAVIVANAVHDHAAVASWALRRGNPVLVEKPVTASAAATRALAQLAQDQSTLLCSAHVFAFASYLDRFSEILRRAGPVHSLEIIWTDPKGEERHGERKTYDSAVPIYADWMPHILSILWKFVPSAPAIYEGLVVDRGGATVHLQFRLGGVPATVQLERNAGARRRFLRAVTAEGEFTLDFTQEPGIINSPEGSGLADPSWPDTGRPLAMMLASFLRAAAGGEVDPRLDITIGVKAAELMDIVGQAYNCALADWILARIHRGRLCHDPDLCYRLSELVQSTGRLEEREVRARIRTLIERHANPRDDGCWLEHVELGNYQFPDTE